MMLKNRQIYALTSAHEALDGAKDGANVVRFKFSATTLYTLAKNLRRLADVVQDLEKTRTKLQKKWGITDPKLDSTARAEATRSINEEWLELMEAETDIILSGISLSALKLDENNIPVTTLANLDFILIEDESKTDKPAKAKEAVA